jgi:hypothetical protein
MFQDLAETVTDISQAISELSNESFVRGAQYTKFVVGKIVAQTAVVKDFFATVLNILPNGSINVPSGSNQIAGSDVLPQGASTYFVTNTKVTAGAKIFITPRSMLALPIAVTEVKAGEGFTVTLAGQAPSDIPFDWFMLSTYQAGAPAQTAGTANASFAPTPVPAPTPTPQPTPDPAPVVDPSASSTPSNDTSASSTPSVTDPSASSTTDSTASSTVP